MKTCIACHASHRHWASQVGRHQRGSMRWVARPVRIQRCVAENWEKGATMVRVPHTFKVGHRWHRQLPQWVSACPFALQFRTVLGLCDRRHDRADIAPTFGQMHFSRCLQTVRTSCHHAGELCVLSLVSLINVQRGTTTQLQPIPHFVQVRFGGLVVVPKSRPLSLNRTSRR